MKPAESPPSTIPPFTMETITCRSSDDFVNQCQAAIQQDRFKRIPLGKQVWVYGDGHVFHTKFGHRGGTAASNLSFMMATGTGRLKHATDLKLVREIDKRGGVVIIFTGGWKEPVDVSVG